MTTCPHCGEPVIVARMRRTNAQIQLDPTPHARGNLQRIDPGGFAQFIAPDWRNPKSAFFVPPEERFQSHRATCTANERTRDPELDGFIDDCDRQIEATR